jgi:hypothetical protein
MNQQEQQVCSDFVRATGVSRFCVRATGVSRFDESSRRVQVSQMSTEEQQFFKVDK